MTCRISWLARFTAAIYVVSCVLPMIASADQNRLSRRPPWTTSRVRGAPDPPAPYKIVAAFPNLRFENPSSIEQIPDADRLLVTEMGGKIYSFRKDANVKQADVVVDLNELLPDPAGGSVSLFDAEFHPDFARNRYLFICYVHPAAGGHTRVSRLTLTDDPAPRVSPNSEQVVITWPAGGHNAGCLEFGKDGYLYIATGDGSGPNPPDGLTTGQNLSDLLGAILRIDVARLSGDQGYAIPPDNPFLQQQGARPEIWAYGLRNPWKFGIDAESGHIYAADNGWETWEMVHRIIRGGNCGWPIREGRAALRTEVAPGPTPIIPPVKDHSHTEANSVIGGPVYRGNKLPGLHGSFVYGDYITGTIWSITPRENDTHTHATLVDTDQRIVAFTEGSQGELYVLDYDFTGAIYELLPSGLKDTSADFPRQLSGTGLFDSLADLKPAPGVVPYAVRVNRWVDGAEARRWIAIPGEGKVHLSSDKEQPAVYPEGTVLVKHLSLPREKGQPPLRLETQILHYENSRWQPYSYLWDDEGREAHLVESIGADRPLQITDPAAPDGFTQRTWHVSAANECKLCHNAGSGYVLGFSPQQLNRPSTAGDADQRTDQLDELVAVGALTEPPLIRADDASRLVDPHDASANLNDRGRSYLHANCSMCHHPGGNAIVSFYLTRDLPFDRLNTNKGTGIGTFGMKNAKIIVPGDPYRSVLMYRMAKLGYARMPYIGSRLVDSQGVALIDEWIRSLSREPSPANSAPTKTNSDESAALRLLAKGAEATREQQANAIRELLQTTEGTLAMIAQMHRGSFAQDELRAAVSLGSQSSTADVRGLFETFVPESERRARLGPNIKPETILSLTGDHGRGKLIFFSDTARCRGCHERDDADKSVGPTLTEIVKKYPRRSELLQHVLQPSLKVDEKYRTFSVITHDGRAYTGLMLSKTEWAIELKTAEQKTRRIPRQMIDDIHQVSTSLMPERLLSDLSPQEAADLIEYVMQP